MFIIAINTENEAFDGHGNDELARLLREIANKVESGVVGGTIMDINGNSVGTFVEDDLSPEG